MSHVKKGATLTAIGILIAMTSGLIVRTGLAGASDLNCLSLATSAMAMVGLGALVGAVGSGVVCLEGRREITVRSTRL